MTREEQFDWLDEQAIRDPFWADQESQIRAKAVDIHKQLSYSSADVLHVAFMRRSSSGVLGMEHDEHTFRASDFVRIGGIESVLLIEQVLREAIYGS
jgi:hypothetical protein